MLPDIRNILYATDLSENAAHACRYAAYLAKLTGAEIHVLHVAEKLSADALLAMEGYMMSEKGREQSLKLRKQRTWEVLQEKIDEFWSQQDEEGSKLRKQIAAVEICEGYPAEEILRKVSTIHCDLIVMGAHEKGIVHTFLGSVAKSVLRRSRVPTLIVPLPEA